MLHFNSEPGREAVELTTDREELKGFSRSFAELEWLLLILVLLYFSVSGSFVTDEFALILAMTAFAAFVIVFRYINFYHEYARWKLAVETWVMIAFVTCVLWFTGGNDSALINLFLLVIIFSALTLGKIHTMLVMTAIALIYLYMEYDAQGIGVLSLQTFGELMAGLSPFLLVAYLTTMLSADIHMAKRQIKHLATTDELTETFNMRAFRFMFEKELQKAERYAKNFSLLMIDADGLKQTNDQFGHGAGDRLIQALANKLQDELRSADILARYGGDEFIILMSETDKAAAEHAADRIRGAIEAIDLDEAGARYGPTVSIGIATYPGDGSSVTALLDRADRALYQSKKNGGNCVTAYS